MSGSEATNMPSRQKQAEYKELRAQKDYIQAAVQQMDPTHLKINDQNFILTTNHKEAFDIHAIADRYMDIFDEYDFIVGDWSFEQLRLKGFFADDVKRIPHDKYISHLEDYLIEYCSFGCAYFVIEHERTIQEREARNHLISNPNTSNNQRSKKSKSPSSKNSRFQNSKCNSKTKPRINKESLPKQNKANSSTTDRPIAKSVNKDQVKTSKHTQFQIYDKNEARVSGSRVMEDKTTETTETITTKNGVKSQIKIRKKKEKND